MDLVEQRSLLDQTFVKHMRHIVQSAKIVNASIDISINDVRPHLDSLEERTSDVIRLMDDMRGAGSSYPVAPNDDLAKYITSYWRLLNEFNVRPESKLDLIPSLKEYGELVIRKGSW